MKYLVFSDLHGSKKAWNAIQKAFEIEKADRYILLGDILGGYDGGDCSLAQNLAQQKDRIVAVRGNCDYPEDEYSLGFPLPLERQFLLGRMVVHLSHRPEYQREAGTIYLNGHTHRKTLCFVDGAILMNPGSCALPRDGVTSYGVLEIGKASLHRLDDCALLQEILF